MSICMHEGPSAITLPTRAMLLRDADIEMGDISCHLCVRCVGGLLPRDVCNWDCAYC